MGRKHTHTHTKAAKTKPLQGITVEPTQLVEMDWNDHREDHDVDIFNIIQKVQDTVIHLEVDEEQCGRSHKEVRNKPSGYGPHVRCRVYGSQILLMHKKQQWSTRLDRKQ